MRTIKFRGERLDNGEWVYGYLIKLSNGECHIFSPMKDTTQGEFYNWKVGPYTIGQFTGMFDKNGQEIYEGDILEDADLRYEVCWYDEIAAFMAEDIESKKPFLLSDLDLRETVVIGNIFDNPELITSKQ